MISESVAEAMYSDAGLMAEEFHSGAMSEIVVNENHSHAKTVVEQNHSHIQFVVEEEHIHGEIVLEYIYNSHTINNNSNLPSI